MRLFSAAEVAEYLDYPSLIDALQTAFAAPFEQPVRHHHAVTRPDEPAATLLLMPAWLEGDMIGVKLATVFPGNQRRQLPSVYASYMLLNGTTGEPCALLDGTELTRRRTAAASVLAARYLARSDAKHLVICGTGQLAPHFARAYRVGLGIEDITIWGRDLDKARALALLLAGELGIPVQATDQLQPAVTRADVVSCLTLAREPFLLGEGLPGGCHVDLVGGFTPEMREADDECLRRCRVYVDTRAGAAKEAGDIVQGLARGVMTEADIHGDLLELCRGRALGRQTKGELTLFKSVGAAIEDLAAARLVWQRREPTE